MWLHESAGDLTFAISLASRAFLPVAATSMITASNLQLHCCFISMCGCCALARLMKNSCVRTRAVNGPCGIPWCMIPA